MATFYADSAAPGGGDGSAALPYNAIPSNALGTNDWFIRAGSVFALGASQLTAGNTYTVRKWGEGANPQFTFTNEGFSSQTATGTGLIDGIDFIRLGSRGGTGVNVAQMGGGAQSVTIRNCRIANWTSCVQADRCKKLIAEDNIIEGTNATYGIRGRAQLTINCDDWVIRRNTFSCGVDIELSVSNTDCSLGSFNNPLVEHNVSNGPSGCGTAWLMRGAGLNATNYDARAEITGAGSGGGNLVREGAAPVWPNWQAGTVLFLAGWLNVANFGTVTVVSGGGTRTIVVTNLGATLVNEAIDRGKGCAVIDPARAFNNPILRHNTIRNRGETPMFTDIFRGGVVEHNEILNTVSNGTSPGSPGSIAAAIEAFGCRGTIYRRNTIDGIYGFLPVDGVGIFLDGACEDCVAVSNTIKNCRPTTPSSDAGAGMGAFYSRNCRFESNVVDNCQLGFGGGGLATSTVINNNTITNCDYGFRIGNQPAPGAIQARSNLFLRNDVGIRDSSTATVSTNAWWQNTVDNDFGALSAKDASAITSDPQLAADLHPLPGSPMLEGGLDLGYRRDRNGTQSRKFIGAYAVARMRKPLGAT